MLSKYKLSIILLMSFLFSFCIGFTASAQSPDIVGHWAEKQISAWQSKGLAQGYSDGSFKPDNNISRAEFIVMVNKAFGYSAKAQVSYKDVIKGAWYEDEVSKAEATGYITGYSDGTMRPDNQISRQESAVIIARLLRLSGGSGNFAAKFKDAAGIEGWSKDSVNAVVYAKYMSGYKDGTFRAGRPITRAEVVTLLNRVAGELYNVPGTYGPEQGQAEITGNVTISSQDVKLQNSIIGGDLYLTEGIGEGNVNLKNVTVKGRTLIKGGGVNSIVVDNSSLGSVEIAKPTGPVRLAATGNTTVAQLTVNSAARLDSTGAAGSVFGNVVISQVSAGDAVTLKGSFGNVVVNTPGVKVDVAGGKVANFQVSNKGADVTLSIAGGATVTTLTVDSAAKVTGGGSIGTAKVNAPGTTIEQTPGKTEVADNAIAIVGGKPVNGTPAPTGVTGGGGGGGGGNPPTADTSPPINAAGYPKAGIKTDTTGNILVKNDESGKAHFVVLPSGETGPTATQVKAGTDAADGALAANMKGNISLAANTELTIAVTGLVSATTYDIYVVCEDTLFNVQTTPAKVSVTTDPAPPVLQSAETDTTGTKVVLTFDKAMADPAGKEGSFNIWAGGVPHMIDATALNDDHAKIELTLIVPLTHEETVTISYPGETVLAADGTVLGQFDIRAVTNNVIEAEPVVVKKIKIVSIGAISKRYIDVAKFDGTNTSYEIKSNDTVIRIDGIKIDTAAFNQTDNYASADGPRLLTPDDEIMVGSIVKLYFYPDGSVSQIRTFGSELENGSSFTINKDNNTFAIGGGSSLTVDSNTKIIKVTDICNNISGDNIAAEVGGYVYHHLDLIQWSNLMSINVTSNSAVSVIKGAGTARYIALQAPDNLVPTVDSYGVVANYGTLQSGLDFINVNDDLIVVGTIANAHRGDVIRYNLGHDAIIDSGSLVNPYTSTVNGAAYNYFKIVAVDKTNKRLEVAAVGDTDGNNVSGAANFNIFVNDQTSYFSTNIQPVSIDNFSSGDIVQIYDAYDRNGYGPEDAPLFDANELIFDFIIQVPIQPLPPPATGGGSSGDGGDSGDSGGDGSTDATHFGVLYRTGTSPDGHDAVWITTEGSDSSYIGTIPGAQAADLVKFTLTQDFEIDSGAVVVPYSISIAGANYSNFKVMSIDKTIKRIEVIAIDGASTMAAEVGISFWIDYNNETYYFDTEMRTSIKVLTEDDLCSDDIIQIYDTYDGFGNAIDDPVLEVGDWVFDFVIRVDK